MTLSPNPECHRTFLRLRYGHLLAHASHPHRRHGVGGAVIEGDDHGVRHPRLQNLLSPRLEHPAGLGQSITTWQLRRALEVGAYVDRLEDYNPVTAVFDLGAQPPIDAAPWATLGWGNLSALPDKAVVAETLAQLGFGSGSRTKAAEFCDFQTANIRRRKTYWDAPGPGWFFNSYDTPADDPFLYCGSVIP